MPRSRPPRAQRCATFSSNTSNVASRPSPSAPSTDTFDPPLHRRRRTSRRVCRLYSHSWRCPAGVGKRRSSKMFHYNLNQNFFTSKADSKFLFFDIHKLSGNYVQNMFFHCTTHLGRPDCPDHLFAHASVKLFQQTMSRKSQVPIRAIHRTKCCRQSMPHK